MKKHHLFEDYMLLSFHRESLKQILSVPHEVYGAYVSGEQWREILQDDSLLTNNKHTIYVLQLASASGVLRSDKIKFIEQYIRIQKMAGQYPE